MLLPPTLVLQSKSSMSKEHAKSNLCINKSFKYSQQVARRHSNFHYPKQKAWVMSPPQIPQEPVRVVEVVTHRELATSPHPPHSRTPLQTRTTSNIFINFQKDLHVTRNHMQKFDIRLLETRSTISCVMSFTETPWLTTTLWRRNLSLHCMSGGASRCACIVTEANCCLFRYKFSVRLPESTAETRVAYR